MLNETRVVPARLFTRLERTGRAVEALLSHEEGGEWRALLGPGRRLRPGDRLNLLDANGRVVDGVALVVAGRAEGPLWKLATEGAGADEMMSRWGHVPLPPYIARADASEDRSWYQTVYARSPGAVAAPTAGLHFDEAQLADLEARGIERAPVVLHVGPGTFLPVRAQSAEEHRVLPERYEVPDDTAARIGATRARGGKIVAVGTTVVRTLETWAREGGGTSDALPPRGARGWTDLTILPGHRFRALDALVTNFHLPRSSLLLLVAAWAGRDAVLETYAEAVERGYRFYSYGDAMLIL